MTNIVNLTEERIKNLDMDDLKTILSAIEESEAKVMINAIRNAKWTLVANMIEFVTYRTMQGKVVEALHDKA